MIAKMWSIFFLYIHHTTSLTQQLCNHSLRARTHFRNSKSVIAIIPSCSETAHSSQLSLWYFGFLFSYLIPFVYPFLWRTRQGARQDRRDRYAAVVDTRPTGRIDNRIMFQPFQVIFTAFKKQLSSDNLLYLFYCWLTYYSEKRYIIHALILSVLSPSKKYRKCNKLFILFY